MRPTEKIVPIHTTISKTKMKTSCLTIRHNVILLQFKEKMIFAFISEWFEIVLVVLKITLKYQCSLGMNYIA